MTARARQTLQGAGLTPARQPRSFLALMALSFGALVFFSGFIALGTWQVYRRSWKLDLIARVEQRVHAAAVPAPGPSQWADVTAANSEYRHVRASGTFLNDSETLVQATTELGAGFWVLTPLRQADNTIVLINRGFVPPERRDRAAHGASGSTSPATVTGLLRMTEPGGAFLRRNDPAGNRWYSRDVQAIAVARKLSRVAPYFIDADAAPGAPAPARAEAAAAQTPAPASAESAAAHTPAPASAESAAAHTPAPASAESAAAHTPAPASAESAAAHTPEAASAETAAGHTPEAAPPVGGLTIIAFHNSHLTYSITWYTLALMVAGGMWILIREERRLRRESGDASRGLP